MKILISGATGFIGNNLAKVLIEQEHEVLATGSCPERVPKGARFLPHDMNGIDFREVAGVDVLFHLAASNNTLEEDYNQMMHSNFYAATDLFLAVLHNSECNHFVYASSTAVYGNQPAPFKEDQQLGPLNAYGRSKLRFDDYAMEFGKRHDVNVVGLRFCNVFGPGEDHKGPRASMISQLAPKIKRGEEIKLFKNGEQKREWAYVKDTIKACLLASNFAGQEVFNCGTGKPHTFNEVADILKGYFRSNSEISYVDNPKPEIYQNWVETDMTKAREFLKFSPEYDLIEGIADYL